MNNQRRENYLEKPLPSSDDSEKVILGAILIDNDFIYDAVSRLTPEHFYSPLNRRVFAAMVSLLSAGKSIDPILIGEELKKEGSLDSIGGTSVITNLSFGLPHFSSIKEYIDTVLEKATSRAFIRLCAKSQTEALSEEEPIQAVLDRTEQEIYDLRHQQASDKGFKSGGALALASAEEAARRARSGVVDVLGLSTGLRDLDEVTGGLVKKDLIVLGARPSMGKTSLCLNMAMNASLRDPECVTAVFSLEMSQEQLMNRMLCTDARIDSRRYQKGQLLGKEWDALSASVQNFQNWSIEIDEQPKLSVLEMKARCKKLKSKKGRLDLVIVDHLGLAKGAGRWKEMRLELGEIAEDLKAMAKDLDVAVLALCQLSRSTETRGNDHRPRMSDIRESGQIEEHTDLMLLLYRDEYYNKKLESNKGKAEIIVAKNRNGPTESVEVQFTSHLMRFEDLYRG